VNGEFFNGLCSDPYADTTPAKPEAPSEQAGPGGGEQQKAPTGHTNPGRTTQPEKKDEGAKTK